MQIYFPDMSFVLYHKTYAKRWSKTEVEGEKIKIRTAHAYCWHQQCRERVNGRV